VLAHCQADVHLSVGRDTESASADLVSGTFFDVLGLRPAACSAPTTTAGQERTPWSC
jgi:hypothetical protein